MSKAALKGHASGSGIVTLEAPNTNTDRTLTLPDRSATLGIIGPAFSAYQNAAQSVPQSTATRVNLQAVEFDTDSRFNATGVTVNGIPPYAFMPNVPGIYDLHGVVGGAFSGSPYTQVLLRKNGATYVSEGLVDATAGAYRGLESSRSVYLNGTTDYVDLVVVHSGSAAVNTTGGAAITFFEGHFVRSL